MSVPTTLVAIDVSALLRAAPAPEQHEHAAPAAAAAGGATVPRDLLASDLDRDLLRAVIAGAALAPAGAGDGGGAQEQGRGAQAGGSAALKAQLFDLRTGSLTLALAEAKTGPLSSRAVARLAAAPAPSLYDLVSEACLAPRAALDLLASPGAPAALPALRGRRSAFAVEALTLDALKHLEGAEGGKRLLVVSRLPRTAEEVAAFLEPVGAAAQPPQQDGGVGAAAVLREGGAAARALARERLAGLRRLSKHSRDEGISVWWLELGSPPDASEPAALALWLELLRLLSLQCGPLSTLLVAELDDEAASADWAADNLGPALEGAGVADAEVGDLAAGLRALRGRWPARRRVMQLLAPQKAEAASRAERQQAERARKQRLQASAAAAQEQAAPGVAGGAAKQQALAGAARQPAPLRSDSAHGGASGSRPQPALLPRAPPQPPGRGGPGAAAPPQQRRAPEACGAAPAVLSSRGRELALLMRGGSAGGAE
ncbi:MAG: hypothetical protein J3K34DRAFT_476343, partial [Monoraphidium minutum]